MLKAKCLRISKYFLPVSPNLNVSSQSYFCWLFYCTFSIQVQVKYKPFVLSFFFSSFWTIIIILALEMHYHQKGTCRYWTFSTILVRETTFVFSCPLPSAYIPFWKGSTLKGTHLLPNDFFLKKTLLQRASKPALAELPPLSVYRFSLNRPFTHLTFNLSTRKFIEYGFEPVSYDLMIDIYRGKGHYLIFIILITSLVQF